MTNTRRVVGGTLLLLVAACGGGADGGGNGTTGPPQTGTITGQVSGRGGGLPDATVALTGGGTQTTNSEGRFTINAVPVGDRTVTLTPPNGFTLGSGEAAARTANVQGGGTATVNWSLQLTNTTPRTADVSLTAASFDPAEVTVPVGSTIRWVNATPTLHTISPNNPGQPGAWPEVSSISGTGTTSSHRFATEGTYAYTCKLHAGMNGVIRVH